MASATCALGCLTLAQFCRYFRGFLDGLGTEKLQDVLKSSSLAVTSKLEAFLLGLLLLHRRANARKFFFQLVDSPRSLLQKRLRVSLSLSAVPLECAHVKQRGLDDLFDRDPKRLQRCANDLPFHLKRRFGRQRQKKCKNPLHTTHFIVAEARFFQHNSRVNFHFRDRLRSNG